jgi:hypothetical protein
VKSVNIGATFVAAPVSVPVAVFDLPSRWQVLHVALPRKRSHSEVESGSWDGR